MIRQVLSPALSIALLAAIESLLSAVVADGMTGRRHRSAILVVVAWRMADWHLFSRMFRGPRSDAVVV